MPFFQLNESNRRLTSTAGLALIGHCLALVEVERLDLRLPKRGTIRLSYLVRSYGVEVLLEVLRAVGMPVTLLIEAQSFNASMSSYQSG